MCSVFVTYFIDVGVRHWSVCFCVRSAGGVAVPAPWVDDDAADYTWLIFVVVAFIILVALVVILVVIVHRPTKTGTAVVAGGGGGVGEGSGTEWMERDWKHMTAEVVYTGPRKANFYDIGVKFR